MKGLVVDLVMAIIRKFSPSTQVNLSLRILQEQIRSTSAVSGYELRRRISNRFFKSYPMLYSHEALRVYGFFSLLGSLKNIEGDIVECGVGRGRFFAVFKYAEVFFKLNKKLYGFDSFEGFPDPDEKDFGTRIQEISKVSGWDDVTPDMIYSVLKSDIDGEGSKSLLSGDMEDVILVKGFFDQTMPQNLPPKISFLHLDADLYLSTKVALEACLPRMTPNSLIVFDEMHETEKWPGVKKAFDEICVPLGLQVVWLDEVQRYAVRLPSNFNSK